MKKTERLSVRWFLLGFVIAAFVILFKQLTDLGFDETDTIMITNEWVVKMPFSVPVWWNLFLGPIVATSIIALLHVDDKKDRKSVLNLLMFMGIFIGFLGAWLTGRIFGVLITLCINITFIAFLNLPMHFSEDYKYLDSIGQTIVFSYFLGIGNALNLGIIPGLLLTCLTAVLGTIIFVLLLNTVYAFRGLKGLGAKLPALLAWAKGTDIEEEGEIKKENEEE